MNIERARERESPEQKSFFPFLAKGSKSKTRPVSSPSISRTRSSHFSSPPQSNEGIYVRCRWHLGSGEVSRNEEERETGRQFVAAAIVVLATEEIRLLIPPFAHLDSKRSFVFLSVSQRPTTTRDGFCCSSRNRNLSPVAPSRRSRRRTIFSKKNSSTSTTSRLAGIAAAALPPHEALSHAQAAADALYHLLASRADLSAVSSSGSTDEISKFASAVGDLADAAVAAAASSSSTPAPPPLLPPPAATGSPPSPTPSRPR